MKSRILLLSFLYIFSFIGILAQSVPGGIGNTDGSDGQPELFLWLLPDSLSLNDGDDVLNWTDFSGKSQTLSAASSTSPLYRGGALNGHSYLEFSKNNNRILRNPFNMPTEAVAVFMVLKTSSNDDDGLLSYEGAGSANNYLFIEPGSFRTYIDGSQDNSGQSINDGAWNVFSHQWRNSDGRLLMHLNGSELYSTNHRSGVSLYENGSFAIGGEQDGVDAGYGEDQDYDGDIAEIIIYGSSLKQAQRTVIEIYLAQKYGLDANLSTDFFVPEDGSYIQALTGMGKESDGTTVLESDGLVITQNGNFNNGEYIFAAHDGSSNSVNSSPSVLHSEVEATWSRDWYVDKTGTVDAKIAFDLSEGIGGDFPSNIENYRLMYKASLAGSYDTVTVAGRGVQNGDQIYFAVNDADLSDGYYTLGTVDEANSPLEGESGRTWYTLISGDWDNWEVWTLDPSGALPNNPNQLTPSTSPTANADKVVVLTGKTVTVSSDNKTHNTITVDGRLDFQSSSGHSFGAIKGRGRILLSGDHFPTGDATDFISEGQGEGTVEYYGSGFNLATSREFFNLEIDMDTPVSQLTLLNDYTINGELRITSGTLQINDDASATNLNISANGDVVVESNGAILTGSANARHQFNFYGDFTNKGTVEFTNRTAANYGSEATNGIVDANFLSDSQNQTVFIDGPATFYRVEIDKGSDATYELILEATNSSYFNIYGYAGDSHGDTPQLPENDNALGLLNGTVRIKSNVSIPVLNTGGNYNINENARLWIDGGSVFKNSGSAIVPYGKILVSSGLLEAKISSGITTRSNGLVKVEGGILNINQLRTSVLGTDNVGGYVQSGGVVNILGANTTNDYYCFNLSYSGNVFNMTGGTLHIHETEGKGAIFIASDETNYNVSGGTVIMDIGDGNDFPITSTAPFWNVILRNTSGGSGEHILADGVDVGSSDENLSAQPLRVLNDLTIEADAFLNHDGNDVFVGRDFYIDRDAQRKTFDDSGLSDTWNDYNIGYLYDQSKPNNTVFNGSEDGEFYIGYNSSDGFEQFFHDLTVEKTPGSKVTVVCDNQKSAQYQDDNNRNHWHARLVRIEDDLTVESGILDQGRSSFRLYGPLTIGLQGECGVWEPGTTHPWAMVMMKDADLNINTEEGAVLGNVKMNPNPQTDIISFSSDVYVKRIAYFHGRINLQSNTLKLDYLHDGLTTNNYDISDGNSNEEMFFSSGNASDGGLLLYVPASSSDGTTFSFPLGMLGKYTPGEITLSNVVDDGYIRLTPVDSELQTTDLSGGDILQYYWKLDYEGFENMPTIDRLRLFYDGGDVAGNESNYVAGKVLDAYPFDRIYEDEDASESEGVNTSNNHITFNGQTDTGFTLEKASYTAGVIARFQGTPDVFYLRRNGDWDNNNTWSFSRGGPSAGDYPKAGDIAVIRRFGTSYSGIVTVRNAERAAAVIFDDENGWSSGCPRVIFSSKNNYDSFNSVFSVFDVADTHKGGVLDYNTHGAVVQYNVDDEYSNASTSLQMDGQDDYIAIQNYNYSGGGHQELTVEAWVKTDDGSDQVIASFDRNQFWRLEINGEGAGTGQVGFDVMTDAGQLDFGGTIRIDDGEWHHVAAVYDNGDAYIYVDGVLDNSTSRGSTFGSGVTRYGFIGVGSEANFYDGDKGPTNYFNGSISEVRVWNIARSKNELSGSMDESLSGTESGLNIYYKLDGSGSDNIATDYTSNGNSGTLMNYQLPGAWKTAHPWSSSFPGGDFGGFNNYPNALVIYSWENAPANADITLSAAATEYPQMWFSNGNGSRKIRFPNTDVTIHGGFTIPSDVIVVANGDSDNTITMEQNMNIGHSSLGYGKFLFPGAASGSVTLNVEKDIRVRGSANSEIGIENAAASAKVHKLIAKGDITVVNDGGRIRLGDGDPAKTNVELEFQGDSDNTFVNNYGSDTPQFYRLIMNKGTDNNHSFSLNSNFDLTGSTDGADQLKAVELQNGKLIFNNSGINVDLTTGDDDFVIPGTAGLEVIQGQLFANGNSGIVLDGSIEISGGTLDMSGGDNYIQYSASGNAAIDISVGSLIVGSQIRRGLTSSEGILSFSQSGGTVVAGNNTASENNRGVFEILNDGSHFEITGGDFYIVRSQNNPETAAFYLDPETSALDPSATLHFGHTNTPSGETLGVYSTVDLPNVMVDNSSGNDPELKMWTVPMSVSGDLTVESGASLNGNGLDLNLSGDLFANGAFVANGNTTYIDSDSDQQISGSPVFYNLSKTNAGTLTLNNDVTVENVFDHQSGILSDGGNTLTIEGDVFFNGGHTWGGSGKGIYLAGETQQNLQGSGVFGKLSINNPGGVFVPEGNTINIDGALQLESGVFDIGKNLLELTVDADIIEANAFSEENMIQTNISFTDNGIKKWFPAISSATTFIYPLGSTGKYTPVEFNIDQLDAGSFIRVKAADEKHPTVVDDDEPCNDITDTQNVLDYHWTLETSGVNNFSGNASMKYYSDDVLIDNSLSGTSYDITDYATARLLRNSTDWNKYDANSFDESNELLMFYFSNTDDNGVSGDYTAGVEDQSGSCEGAIPDQVPTYITTTDGIWGDGSIWDTYPTSGGTVPAGGPRGSAVIIAHDVSMTNNYKVSYKTEIQENGTLSIGSTFGHRLGEVTGQGTLSLLRGELPAGVYDQFLSATGGTLEYGGSNDYDVLSENTFVNNLRFTGSGERRLPNIDLEVYGDIELDGPSLINEHDRTLSLNGDFIFDAGIFDAGNGNNAKVVFNGNGAQNIDGLSAFTGGNAFNHFEINNSFGVTVKTDVETEGVLSLTEGVVNNISGSRFTVTSYDANAVLGGGASSYVWGPFEKSINTGGSFNFPVGASGRLGELNVSSTQTASASIWEVTYFNHNPGNDGFDPNSFVSPLQFVSNNEYWQVKASESTQAHITVRWDSQSGVSADPTERQDLRLVSWEDLSTDAWDNVGGNITDNGQNSGTIQSDALLNFNEFVDGDYFTIGGVQIYNYSWVGNTEDWFTAGNWATGNVPSLSTEIDIPESPSGGSQPVINGDAFCKDLSLEANSSLTLRAGSTLEIANDVDNSGTIVLESTNSSLSSLMLPETMTNSGNVNVKLTLDPDHYWYMSSPLQNTVAGWFKPSEDVSKDYVYVFEVVDNRWQWIRLDQSDVDNNRPIGDMQGIVGYYYTDTKHLDYTGTVQNTDLTVTPDDPGYHLVGNPYPTAIDWEDPAGWTRAGFSNTIWSWINYGGERIIQTYNNNGDALPGVWTLEPNGYDASTMSHIPPYQSVWMKQESETAVPLTVKRAARVKNSDAPLKSASSGDGSFEMIRIKAENAHTMDATVLYFNGSFITGKGSEDSEKRFNGSEKVPEVYTSLNTQALAINGQPLLSAEENAYALSVRNRVEGEVRLVFDLDEFTDVTYDVLLEDKVTGAWTDLRDINEYAYTPVQMGDDHDRFVLHLDKVKEVPTSVENPESSAKGDITIVGKDEYAIVTISDELLSAGNAVVELMDMNGRLIERKNTTDQETEIALSDNSGMYIVKVAAGGVVKTEKVVGASL
ncbi:LamG-like jellyroll fold domain-containing protein [Marinilabilia rubra]|nr:LamG-like jellyroll fold domain-containing protein [Marinilabilia rubra]